MNPLKGEATVEVDGSTLTLVLDNNAWCEIEEVLDLSYLEVLAKLFASAVEDRPPQNRIMRAILWGATREHHPELTLRDCGDLLMRHSALFDPLSVVVSGSTLSVEPVAEDDASGEAMPATKPASRKRKSAAS